VAAHLTQARITVDDCPRWPFAFNTRDSRRAITATLQFAEVASQQFGAMCKDTKQISSRQRFGCDAGVRAVESSGLKAVGGEGSQDIQWNS
jgi:hypothetical protein